MLCLVHPGRQRPALTLAYYRGSINVVSDLGHYFQQHMEILRNRGKKEISTEVLSMKNFLMASHWL